MGTLTAALHWAQRGFSVFPLIEGGKEPLSDDWPSIATTDPETIRRMWTDPVLKTERQYNIGCLCNDMVVIDIDVKKGKDGYNEYMQLGGHYDTLVVQTPTGGYHCYFNGPDSSNSPISNSIDVRSHNGFVVAPGSILPGYGSQIYTVINDTDIAWIPGSLERLLTPVRERADMLDETATQQDSQASIAAAIRFLETAPVAIEGQRGDDTTFQTAARLVREMALSVPTAFALLRDYWNDRCQPPWPHQDLWLKVENAAAYGTADLGKLTPEHLFGHLYIEPPPTIFEQLPFDWGNMVLPERIPPRPWLVERALMTGAVTLLLAAGSAGKSTMSLALAAHLALGKDFAGYKCRRPCKTIIYNGEDDLHEQSRRLLAVCMAYGFSLDDVRNNILLLGPRDIKFDLAAVENRHPYRNEVLVKALVEKCGDPDVGLLVVDPLVKVHKCDESDNVQMDFVMETLTDIAQQAKIAVLALHHTSKGLNRQEERIGNMDIGRGASAIVNAARIAFTLLNASKEDAENYDIQDEERHKWVRLDDAKMNLALSTDKATWFFKESIKIYSGDLVGIMRHADLSKSQTHIRNRIARLLISSMLAGNTGSLTMAQGIAICKASEPLWAAKTDTDVRRKLEGFFTTSLEIEGRTIRVARTSSKTEGGNDRINIVMN